MMFGVSYSPTAAGIGPAELAVEVERLGFDALFVSEHSHVPVDTVFPLPGEVPHLFKSMFDPFVALAAAAAVTSRIKLGTGILLIPPRVRMC